MGLAKPRTRITFVSQAAMGRNIREKLGLRSCVEPVCNIRGLNKHDMVRNGNLPKIEVDPETFAVKVDGVHATVKPAQKVAWWAMSRRTARSPGRGCLSTWSIRSFRWKAIGARCSGSCAC